MTAPTASSSCPYAVALEDDEVSTSTAHSSGTTEVLKEARRSCPAFSQGESCPFANAKDAAEIRKTLQRIPPSHYEEKDYFRKALEQIHAVSPMLRDQQRQFSIPGGCPVSSDLDVGKNDLVTFTSAMEQFSLAAIMAKMATELEDVEHADEDVEGVIVDQTGHEDDEEASSKTLSQAFKTGTADAHKAAEDVHFVKNFIRGEISRELYADLVLKLYHVYGVFEEALDVHGPVHFASCHFPTELRRTEALQEDADFWVGANADSESLISPATRDYIDRIHYLADTNPLLLLAHAYTRYLGDLSGGKVLARVARRALHLGKGCNGLAFYHFDNIPSAKRFKDMYRVALDHLELTQSQVESLVQEAIFAFLLNMRLFEELDVKANVPGAKVRSLRECVDIAFHRSSPSGTNEEIAECPFLVKKDKASTASKPTASSGGRCPWPFVFFHDPKQGLQDFQTWVVVGLLLCWLWRTFQM